MANSQPSNVQNGVPAGDALLPRELIERVADRLSKAQIFPLASELRAALSHQPAQEQAEPCYGVYRQDPEYDDGREFFFCSMWHNETNWGEGHRVVKGRFVPDSTIPAQAAQQEPVAATGSIGDLTEFHVLLNWYDNEASYGSINEGRNKLTEYIDKWADRRAAQLDGGQEGSD